VRWFLEQSTPYFLGVVDQEELKLSLYSTWQRVHARSGFGHADELVLVPDETGDVEFCPSSNGPERGRKEIPLGPPIATITLKDLVANKQESLCFGQIWKKWIELDQRNLSSAEAGVHLVCGPGSHTTNAFFSEEELKGRFYYNGKNVERTFRLPTLLSTSMRLELEQILPGANQDRRPKHVHDLLTALAHLEAAMTDTIAAARQPP
jgi:hypothetical protein